MGNDTKLKELLADEFLVTLFESTEEMFPMFAGGEREYNLEKVYSATDPLFSIL